MKHLKFISAFLVAFALILACVPVQASADEDEYELQKINVLDYGFPNGLTYNYCMLNASNNYSAMYSLPFKYPIIYADIIFESTREFSSVGIMAGNTNRVCYLDYSFLDNGLHRAYGKLDNYFDSTYIGFYVLSAAGSGITIHRFDLYTYVNQGVPDLGEFSITPDADTKFEGAWHRMTAVDTPMYCQFYNFGSTQFTQYTVDISSVNWRNYDYLDFRYDIRAADIYSIVAYIDTSQGFRYLPFDISWGAGQAIDENEYIGSGSTTVVPAGNDFHIMQRLYIPRETVLDGSLHIVISGNYAGTASGCYFYSVTGYYYLNVPDSELVKMDQMIAAIRESLSSSDEDNAAAEEFADNMTSQKEQMASNQQTLNNVSKPSSDDLGMMVAPDAVLDADGMTALVSIINPITDSRIVLGILTLSATLALVSYVFFGKKR